MHRSLLTTLVLVTGLALPGTVLAGSCPRGQSEYLVDWTSFSSYDAGADGLPTRAWAFPVAGQKPAPEVLRVEVILDYAGLTRRFSFDRPKVEPHPDHPGGAMLIGQDLLEPMEQTETRLHFDYRIHNLSLVLENVDDNARFANGSSDLVQLSGIDLLSGTGPFSPAIDLPDVPQGQRAALLRVIRDTMETDDGMLSGLPLTGIGSGRFATLRTWFRDPVTDMALRLSSMDRIETRYSATQNPSTQEIVVTDARFCLETSADQALPSRPARR